MPLSVAPIGKETKIVKTLIEEKVRRHLENLGIFTGEFVTPVQDINGDLIVKVKDSRIALNKALASKIFVC